VVEDTVSQQREHARVPRDHLSQLVHPGSRSAEERAGSASAVQAIFVGSALPRALRVTEIDFHLRGHGEALVFSPRSQVNERRRDAGSLRTCRLSAATMVAVSLLGTLTRMVKRECRSTSVAI